MRGGRLLRLVPRPVYAYLKRSRLLKPVLSKGLDVLIGEAGIRPTTIAAGPLQGLTLELDPRVNKDMVVGRYEPHVMAAIEEAVAPGQTAFDIGAHLGYATLVMARLLTASGKVIAFEPDPHVSDALARNVASGEGVAPVEAVRMAVAGSTGTARFLRGTTTGTGALGDGDFEVDTITLDDAAGRFGRPEFVKLDVEGAEVEVLRGAAGVIDNRATTWLIEAHSPDLEKGCVSLLEASGHTCRRIGRSTGETTHILAVPSVSS